MITIGDGSKVPASELSYIARDLWPLTVPIDSLKQHDRNVRLHNEANFEATKQSLLRFGQQKTISVDAEGMILAGNGTERATRALGRKYIARARTNLTGAEALAWAIADNRSGELAEWDAEELQNQLREIADEEIDVGDLGFDEEEIEALLDGDFETAHGFTPEKSKPEAEVKKPKETFQIVLTFDNEKRQTEWLEKLNGVEGLKIRTINA